LPHRIDYITALLFEINKIITADDLVPFRKQCALLTSERNVEFNRFPEGGGNIPKIPLGSIMGICLESNHAETQKIEVH